VRAAIESVDEDAAAAGIEIRLSVPSDPVTVAIEDELLERIVQPLLDNAIRYGDTVVSIEIVRDGSTAVVDVVDDGIGIAVDELELVFEPGVRGTAAAGKPGGAGLGLALAQRLARSAGGEIVARPDRPGSHFSIRLPLA
jgi:signal transduction histidine kinase